MRQEIATVQLSPRAPADLERIFEFIAEHDPALETLNDYVATITNACEAVRVLVPDLHRPHDGLRGRAAVRLGVNAPGETKMMPARRGLGGAHRGAPLPAGDEDDDAGWMRQALLLAQRAREAGEVPVGAVLVREGEVLGEGWNCPIAAADPTAHAEVVALRAAASRVGNYRLLGATLYVTLEPCVMCAGAILHARLARVVFGALDPKGGAAGSVFTVLGTERLNHRVEVRGGCLGEACGEVLQLFFQERRRDSAGPSGYRTVG